MDSEALFETLVAPLRADTLSGATQVAAAASRVLHQAALEVPGESPDETRVGLAALCVKVLDAQPAMAPLAALVCDVLAAARTEGGASAVRSAAAEAAERFHRRIETRRWGVARRAAHLLPRQGTLLTVSSSATVRDALLYDAPLRDLRVICLEGRPMYEGRLMAEALASAGVEVVVAVDAAADALVTSADVVLLGADSVGDRGVVNKIGSLGVARAAQRRGVPVHVATDETKILPPGFPQSLTDDRPAHEVWDAPRGVSVWNRYFEAVPLDAITSLVTDETVYRPEELEERRHGEALPDEIRAWAEAHGAEGPTPL